MFEEKCIYHSERYKEVTNVTKLKRLSVRKCEVEATDENKVQITETNEQEPEMSVKCTRSKSILYRKGLCVICQKGGKLRKAAVKSTGKRMLNVQKFCLITIFSYGLTQYRLQKMLLQMMWSIT